MVVIMLLVPDEMCSTLTVPTCSMSKNTCTPSTVEETQHRCSTRDGGQGTQVLLRVVDLRTMFSMETLMSFGSFLCG